MTFGQSATLLTVDGYGIAEYAARTAYQSFDSSENKIVRDMPIVIEDSGSETFKASLTKLDKIKYSKLLEDLVWAHHHESILEHIIARYHIITNRGVLQEWSRTRIGMSQTVQSSRYTMSKVINAYCAFQYAGTGMIGAFTDKCLSFDMLAIEDEEMQIAHFRNIYDQLALAQRNNVFSINDILVKSSIAHLEDIKGSNFEDIFVYLENQKKKRNAGDKIKFIVSDIWKVELVTTFNLRGLKTMYGLRASGAAWEPYRLLAEEMYSVLPEKYQRLIVKPRKEQ